MLHPLKAVLLGSRSFLLRCVVTVVSADDGATASGPCCARCTLALEIVTNAARGLYREERQGRKVAARLAFQLAELSLSDIVSFMIVAHVLASVFKSGLG